MTFDFENTKLWQRTLAERHNDPDAKARDRFRTAFLSARDAVAPLVAQIGKELPSLTAHDITHLDALWDVADVVIGHDYEISPAEGFVLGMAFLLHDAATSTAAFKNGIEDVKATVEWKDLISQRHLDAATLSAGTPQYQSALFEVLRILHPKQAEKLLHIEWKLLNGSARYVVEDSQIRTYYGSLIGKIAHSHWWDAASVEVEWGNSKSITLQSSFKVTEPERWRVDAFKIALILRCVDAAHIDSRRAPDMLGAIVQPNGLSGSHWFFQNSLGLPSFDEHGDLYWTAGKPFDETHAEAWWLCFDTAKMIDKEIRHANRLLKSNDRKALQAQGVSGVSSTSEFSKIVPVEGWHPVDVNFKVSRVTDVVERFGGSALYGDSPWMALRELLQNAADAVRARRSKRNNSAGEISVKLFEENNCWWLEVTDNGIGMSPYVLTEVLLDFGRSLWSDAAVRNEHPGLISSGFKSVGQFGIGFLSVFMLGKEVRVTSWRDGDADVRQHTLVISNGPHRRPILLPTPDSGRLNDCGTRIQIKLDEDPSLHLLSFDTTINGHKTTLSIEKLVAAIVPTLDIDVYVYTSERKKVISANDWVSLSQADLLSRIAPRKKQLDLAYPITNLQEDSGDLLGRISVTSSWHGGDFFDSPGIFTQRGVLAGNIEGIAGVMLTEKSTNLVRTSARPACSKNALERCAKEMAAGKHFKDVWFLRPYINSLISLGLKRDSITFSGSDQSILNASSIRKWINVKVIEAGFDFFAILSSNISTPDDVSESEFQSSFVMCSNVLELNLPSWGAATREQFDLDDWIDELIPADEKNPRDVVSLLLQTLQEAFPNLKIKHDYDAVVGEVNGIEVSEKCTVVTGF